MTITKLWKTISESMLECARPVVAAGVVDPAAHPKGVVGPSWGKRTCNKVWIVDDISTI